MIYLQSFDVIFRILKIILRLIKSEDFSAEVNSMHGNLISLD